MEHKVTKVTTISDIIYSKSLNIVFTVKRLDLPPHAVTSPNVILSLPHDSVILYGNQSSDDHGIVSFQWRDKGLHSLSYVAEVCILLFCRFTFLEYEIFVLACLVGLYSVFGLFDWFIFSVVFVILNLIFVIAYW